MAWSSPRTWVAAETVTAALLNAEVRDNLTAGFPTDAAFSDWTPSLTALTQGNGTVVARYQQVGKLVVCHFTFTLGSTSAVGSYPKVSLPVTASSQYTVTKNVIGRAYLHDNSSTDKLGIVRIDTTSLAQILAENASSTYEAPASITASVPFTWTTNDVIAFTAMYEAA